MKTYAFFFLLSYITVTICMAGIRNGYSDIEGARSSLVSIRKLLDEDKSLPMQERQAMKKKIEILEHYIIYHLLTEELLMTFRRIASDLYAEIDTLKDSMGRIVHVYVKFVPEKELPPGVAGITNLDQHKQDPNMCLSEYGPNSVSVTIATGNKSLSILAHEFGHVQYQSANLADYMHYYKRAYLENIRNRKSIGHNDRDDSGKRATFFAQRFQKHYTSYLRNRFNRPDSHLTILHEIQKEIKGQKNEPDNTIRKLPAVTRKGISNMILSKGMMGKVF